MNMRLLIIAGLLWGGVLRAQADEYVFDTPSDDRWHYPYNFTPGYRAIASCFSTLADLTYPLFNNRDAVLIVAWDTTELIPPGLGPDAYHVVAVTVTVTNQPGAQWPIDVSTDAWYTFDINRDGHINADGTPRGQPGDTDGESSDADLGRPLELFGAGFGPGGYTYATWTEYTPYFGSSYTQYGNPNSGTARPRDPFPFVYQDETFALLHVEDSVTGRWNDALPTPVYSFTPTPWAVGEPLNYVPGAQNVPFDVRFRIDLDLSDGAVRNYVQQQLHAGRLVFIITSLRETVVFGGQDDYPSLYTKEGLGLHPQAKAPALGIVMVDGDADDDGDTDLDDYTLLEDCLAGPAVTPQPVLTTVGNCLGSFDFDLDADVDLADVGAFAGVFTDAP
ncbi:MAG TPA: hypothetical protein PKK06_01985 [Phycisphaerae bacterium]|nr:hypothetical protein [Phycisphaerae bacterium]HNU44105.1 hypothetical protein [Phycisphaerae bacterium]